MQPYLNPAKGWFLFVLAIIIFLSVAALILRGGGLVRLDNIVQDTLGAFRTHAVVKAASIISQLGAIMVDTAVTLASVGYLIWRRELQRALIFLVAIYGLGALTHALKYSVNRQRPPSIEGYFDPSPSFPSDHCAYSTALVLCLVILVTPLFNESRWRKPITAVLLLVPVLIALCRLLLSMHYLSDTIAGISIGFAWVLLVVLVFQRLQKTGMM